MNNKFEAPVDPVDLPWGAYAPGRKTLFLRSLIGIGVSRGFVCKWIRGIWKRRYPMMVDRTVRGIKYRLNISDNTTDGKLLTSSIHYDRREIMALGTGDVFIDIGANTGYYSLTLAKAGFRKVIAIEPYPPTIARLRKNIRLNDMDDVITVIPCCVGQGGEVPFYCRRGLGGASMNKPDDVTPPVYVVSKRLSDIVMEQGVVEIDALKIDVEGSEDQALIPFFESAPESLWPKIIVMEHCHRDRWRVDVIEHLRGIGYRIGSRTRGNTILAR